MYKLWSQQNKVIADLFTDVANHERDVRVTIADWLTVTEHQPITSKDEFNTPLEAGNLQGQVVRRWGWTDAVPDSRIGPWPQDRPDRPSQEPWGQRRQDQTHPRCPGPNAARRGTHSQPR